MLTRCLSSRRCELCQTLLFLLLVAIGTDSGSLHTQLSAQSSLATELATLLDFIAGTRSQSNHHRSTYPHRRSTPVSPAYSPLRRMCDNEEIRNTFQNVTSDHMPVKLAQESPETKATRPDVFGYLRESENESVRERRRKRERGRTSDSTGRKRGGITRGEIERVYRRDGESGTSSPDQRERQTG